MGTATKLKGQTRYTIVGWFYANAMPSGASPSMTLYWESKGDANSVRAKVLVQNSDPVYDNVANTLTFRFRDTDAASPINLSIGANQISAGQWYHFAAVFDSVADVQYVYVNGALAASASNTLSTISNTTPFNNNRIGNDSDTGEEFDGRIDDIRVYNRALTAAEVTALYNATR